MTAPPEFDELYNQYKTMVFSFSYHLTRNRGEAEDLYQETWLRIVNKFPGGIKKQTIKAWIFTIVSNLHKDSLRKKRVRRLFFLQESRSLPNGDLETTGRPDEAERAEIGKDINRAIAVLPESQKRVFILKEMAGLKQAEISKTLAIPKGTVKSLMHRAVKSLQKELSAYRPESIKERGKKCDVKTLSV
jgi:RNA polymerase sigma-70 factor (ECF subfamily)